MSIYSYSLPIEKYENDILKVINQNRVTIIKGPTGCGKSTFIPYLFKDKKVAIIEPRRIAVMSLYNVLSKNISTIGYKMRFSRKISPNTTMTIFTDGAFLNSIQDLSYDYIIIDEVHERTIRTDLILSILKSNYQKKLILMSATLDTTKISAFFKAATYEVPGSGYPVEIKFLEKPTNDYIDESYLTIKNILKTRESGEKKDILVFLPGEEDLNDLHRLCRKIPSISPIKIHSMMSDKDQMRIYDSSNLTRIILSTNICETSLTIPNIKYVIDTGLFKNKIFDEIQCLGIQPISRDSSIQRMGRSNRLGPGVCYKLYTAQQSLPSYVPEILRSDLNTFVLTITSMKKNIFTLEMIDYPPIKNLMAALDFLTSKKCLLVFFKDHKFNSFDELEKEFSNKEDFIDIQSALKHIKLKITNYGQKLAYHPFDVHLSHFYEKCIESKAGYYGSIIVSMISQENYTFLNAQESKICDIEFLVQIFEKFIAASDKVAFCIEKGVSVKGLDNAFRIFKTLNHSKDADLEVVQRIFSRCFDHNLSIRNPDGSYKLLRNGLDLYIHPTSGFFKRKDKKIVVVDIFKSTKVYARIVGKYFENS